MDTNLKLNHPWMVAVWPGMGGVAFNAGVYLLSKLDMKVIAEYEAGELFDPEHIEVKDGLIKPPRRPRNRFFLWTDPDGKHDLVVFLGEAQPPAGKQAFCRQLLNDARQLGIERVFTFAAMATGMRPEQPARVFGAATNAANLEELKRLELEVLEDGHIAGLNGVLLGAAAEAGLHGACLLGEMPQLFAQLPFPKASLAILEVFTTMAGLTIDFTELAEQARYAEEQLGEVLAEAERVYGRSFPAEEEPGLKVIEEEKMAPADERRIESLFEQATRDRSKAFELKQELDRLGVFKEYENRFLDLFKKAG